MKATLEGRRIGMLVDDGSDAGAVQAMGGATDPLRPVITGRFRED